MSNPIIVERTEILPDGTTRPAWWVWCPACFDAKGFGAHRLTGGSSGWTFNGDMQRPTFSPSLLCQGTLVCHSFIIDGQWQYLSDCSHALAGQTVPLPPLPDWLYAEGKDS